MKTDVLSLVRDPETHDALEVKTEPDGRGRPREFLVNPKTGRRYFVREGIPVFLREGAITGSNRKYQVLYDRMARFYDFSTWMYSRWKGMRVEARLREYLDELEVAAGSLVLEISVGTGRNLRILPRSAEFFGLDISWGMLKQCRRNGAKWKIDVNLFMGQAERLPFVDAAFDVVFHFGGINFFNDKAAAVREMVRVAKPGTKFVIGDENDALAKKYEKLPVMAEFYDRRGAAITAPVDLLPAGMQDVRVKDIAGGDLYCLTFRKPR
jgi:ubiquinone/menaquinone biosynthesis C-methylase UbiE